MRKLQSANLLNHQRITTTQGRPITTNTNNIDNLSQNVSSLQSGLESAQSNITTLQNKTYEYLTNEEIDTVFA